MFPNEMFPNKMFPNKSQLHAHTLRVRQAKYHNLQARHRWQESFKSSATSPRGLAIGFTLGFGIGCALRGSPGEEMRKLFTVPTLISAVRAMLLAQ